jgi:hypothetical protein
MYQPDALFSTTCEAWLAPRNIAPGSVRSYPAPEHCLLPHRAEEKGAQVDPARPMDGWKKAGDSLRKEVAKKYPRLARMRMYDLHNAITKIPETPEISERVVEEMAGHRLGSKVKEKYSHIRIQARREAAAALNGTHAPALTVIQFPQGCSERAAACFGYHGPMCSTSILCGAGNCKERARLHME